MLIFAVFAKNYQGSYFGNSIVHAMAFLILNLTLLISQSFRHL